MAGEMTVPDAPSEEEAALIPMPLPTSPPTLFAVIPALEFDFPPTEAQRPTPPPSNIDTRVLWDGFAQLYKRLGKFGAK